MIVQRMLPFSRRAIISVQDIQANNVAHGHHWRKVIGYEENENYFLSDMEHFILLLCKILQNVVTWNTQAVKIHHVSK